MTIQKPLSPVNPDPLLTAESCAEWLNVSVSFVRKVIASGELRSVRFGRSVRVRLSDLKSYAFGPPQ